MADPSAKVPLTVTYMPQPGTTSTVTVLGQVLNNGATNWIPSNGNAIYIAASSESGAEETQVGGDTYYITTGPALPAQATISVPASASESASGSGAAVMSSTAAGGMGSGSSGMAAPTGGAGGSGGSDSSGSASENAMGGSSSAAAGSASASESSSPNAAGKAVGIGNGARLVSALAFFGVLGVALA